MKKVRVLSNVTYSYTIEVEDDVTNNLSALIDACDETEVQISEPLVEVCLDAWRKGLIDGWSGDFISIVDDETGEVLYDY